MGRLPVSVTLDDLGKEELVRVLTEPKNAFVKQYEALFGMDNVKLKFTESALAAAADNAIAQNTGARELLRGDHFRVAGMSRYPNIVYYYFFGSTLYYCNDF